jgi:hypothetical protein
MSAAVTQVSMKATVHVRYQYGRSCNSVLIEGAMVISSLERSWRRTAWRIVESSAFTAVDHRSAFPALSDILCGHQCLVVRVVRGRPWGRWAKTAAACLCSRSPGLGIGARLRDVPSKEAPGLSGPEPVG